MTDPDDVTLASYESAAQRYLERSGGPAHSVIALLDRLAAAVGTGHVLELGSGPGWDADHLARRGVRVSRSDTTPRAA